MSSGRTDSVGMEGRAKCPEAVSVSYDDPVFRPYPTPRIALLQILSGRGEHEGLMLQCTESGSQYQRIGFFIWKEDVISNSHWLDMTWGSSN